MFFCCLNCKDNKMMLECILLSNYTVKLPGYVTEFVRVGVMVSSIGVGNSVTDGVERDYIVY